MHYGQAPLYDADGVEVFDAMLGKTMAAVNVSSEEVTFTADTGDTFRFWHEQDCCESVWVEDVCGDVADLVGHPLLVAEEVTSYDAEPSGDAFTDESHTWTFYRFATVKGTVTIRWYGTSNEYYSEAVSMEHAPPD